MYSVSCSLPGIVEEKELSPGFWRWRAESEEAKTGKTAEERKEGKEEKKAIDGTECGYEPFILDSLCPLPNTNNDCTPHERGSLSPPVAEPVAALCDPVVVGIDIPWVTGAFGLFLALSLLPGRSADGRAADGDRAELDVRS